MQILDKNRKVVGGFDRLLRMLNWNTLYHRYRANFGGLTSFYCAHALTEFEKNGKAVYEQRKKVTNVSHADGSFTKDFEDLVDGVSDSHRFLRGDMVVAAEGSTSHIRQLLQLPLKRTYVDYVMARHSS